MQRANQDPSRLRRPNVLPVSASERCKSRIKEMQRRLSESAPRDVSEESLGDIYAAAMRYW